jgi:hypothetical protein
MRTAGSKEIFAFRDPSLFGYPTLLFRAPAGRYRAGLLHSSGFEAKVSLEAGLASTIGVFEGFAPGGFRVKPRRAPGA